MPTWSLYAYSATKHWHVHVGFPQEGGASNLEVGSQPQFRAFERLHGMQQYPGTGIGLAIVQKGAQRLGGQAGVESEPGTGSRFWVELREAQAPAA